MRRFILTAILCLFVLLPARADDDSGCQGKIISSASSFTAPESFTTSSPTSIPRIAGTWTGMCHGNDPNCRVTLDLKQDGDNVSGTWESEGRSGKCRRYVHGYYDSREDAFICRDVGFDYSNPTHDWSHCLIDKYEFHPEDGGTKLVGTYLSTGCRDQAWFTLGAANNQNRQSATKNTSRATTSNNQKSDSGQSSGTHDIAGLWHGKVHVDDLDFDATLEVSQHGDSINGCLTSVAQGGTSKHYVRGHYDSRKDQFVFEDIGIDKVSGDADWYPAPVEEYTLHETDSGNTLVGSGRQSSSQKTLWVNLIKQDAILRDTSGQATDFQPTNAQPESGDTNYQTCAHFVSPSGTVQPSVANDEVSSPPAYPPQVLTFNKHDQANLERTHKAYLLGEQAKRLMDAEKYRDAQALYQQASRLDPNNNSASIHCDLGFTLQMLGNPEGAIAEYNKALQMNPSFELPLFNIATCYMNAQKTGEAKIYFAKFINEHPESPKRAEAQCFLDALRKQTVKVTDAKNSSQKKTYASSANSLSNNSKSVTAKSTVLPQPAPDFMTHIPVMYSPSESGSTKNALLNDKSNKQPSLMGEVPISQLEQHMLELVNRERAQRGASPVVPNARLSNLARDYAQYMLQAGFFAHVDPQGRDCQARAIQADIRCGIYENLAWQGRGTACTDTQLVDSAHALFMAEPHNEKNHRYNILLPKHACVGIGIARSADKLMMVQEYSDSYPAAETATGYQDSDLPKDNIFQSTDDKETQANQNNGNGRITPAAMSYVNYVQRTIKSHWHPPYGAEPKNVSVYFKIERDGSVSELKQLNPVTGEAYPENAGPVDPYTSASFMAVENSVPFMTPPKNVLDDIKKDYVDIRFTFDYHARHVVPLPIPMYLPFGLFPFWGGQSQSQSQNQNFNFSSH